MANHQKQMKTEGRLINKKQFLNEIRYQRRASIFQSRNMVYGSPIFSPSHKIETFPWRPKAINRINPPPFKGVDDFKKHMTFDSDYFLIYQQMLASKQKKDPSLWSTISNFILHEEKPIFDLILHEIRNNYESIQMEEIEQMLRK